MRGKVRPKNQSDKNKNKKNRKRGRPAAINEKIAARIENTKTDGEIAAELGVSRRTVLRTRKKFGLKKARGGPRTGAGRKMKREAEEALTAVMRRQQEIDCLVNSADAGLRRAGPGIDGWFKYARSAYVLTNQKYVRIEDTGIPDSLPKILYSCPWPRGAKISPGQVWDAIRGGLEK